MGRETDGIRVAVLMGGPDAEREVSLASGEQVALALEQDAGFEVIRRTVDRPGAAELLELGADAIFPVLHGPFGEGGPLQEILESTGLPYVGCRPRAAALAMDKLATKMLADGVGVPTPPSRELRPGEPLDLEPPLVLKPANEGSSVGLRICHDRAAAEAARRELEPVTPRLMAERYVRGREVTVGVVNGETLPIIEIRPAVEFYDYEAKYTREDTAYLLDPELPPGVADALRRHTLAVWNRLGCRHLARADFLVDSTAPHVPWFLEINTMPGMTTHSLVPKAARHAGIGMTALCGGLVHRAIADAARLAASGRR
jgi:D-alanine-D-alanine ligase